MNWSELKKNISRSSTCGLAEELKQEGGPAKVTTKATSSCGSVSNQQYTACVLF